jgi:hypothetical protein
MGQPAVQESQPSPGFQAAELGRMIRSLAVELLIYSSLIVLFTVAAFHFLGPELTRLSKVHLPLYAFAALVLIIGQGVVLEQLTSFLLDRLRLERFN